MNTKLVSELRNNFKQVSLDEILILNVNAAIALHAQIKESGAIEELYEQNSKSYFDVYRKSDFYRHRFLLNIPAVDSIRVQKCLSIYLYKKEKGEGDAFLRKYLIIGFKKIVDYVENNEVLSVYNLIGFYDDRRLVQLTDIERTYAAAILLYLGMDNKRIAVEPLLQTVLHNLYVFGIDNRHQDKSFVEKREKDMLPILRQMQEALGFKVPKEDTLDTLLKEHETFIAKKDLSPQEKKQFVRQNDFDLVYKKRLLRYWKSVTGILRLNQINEMHFDIIPITRDEFLDIGALFSLYHSDKSRLTKEEFDFFLVSSLSNLMMAKHYNELRDVYQTLFEEKSGLSSLLEEEKAQAEISALKEREKKANDTIAQQKLHIERLEAELLSLKKEQKETAHSEADFNGMKKEVVALRNFVFSQDTQYDEYIEEDSLTQELANKKIVIFGGHPKWQQKIKDILPNIRTVEAETLHIDLSFLSHMDIVCFYPNYNNHSQYERVMKALEKSDAELVYANQTNIPSLLRRFSDVIKKKI